MPDLTGRQNIIRNILASWVGYSVYFVAGFVMPRLIDRNLGQDDLGLWDFGWSIVGYFGLSQLGITQSIDRYVAKYRAAGDSVALNRSISSVLLFQCFSTAVVLLITASLFAWMPGLFGEKLGENVTSARWIVVFLGAGVAVTQMLNIFDGITTGCHRWDIHNGLNSGFYALSVAMMIGSVLTGGGVISLAVINFIGISMEKVTRMIIAFKICPELKISLKQAKIGVIREQLFFGGKSLIPSLADVFFRQTVNVMIVGGLGVGALAVFSRPLALIKHSGNIVNKFANVLMPIASSLTSIGKHDELKSFFLKAVSSGALISVPGIVFLSIFGGPLLNLWMGKNYADATLMAVLAVGSLAGMLQVPIYSMLIGLNKHGTAGVAKVIGSFISMGLVVVNFKILELELVGCAIAIGLPSLIVDGIFMPLYATKNLSMPMRVFYKEAVFKPLYFNLPLIVFLALVRWVFLDQIYVGLFVGLTGGVLIGASVYWFWVIPANLKEKIRHVFSNFLNRITKGFYQRNADSLGCSGPCEKGKKPSGPDRPSHADN